MEHNFLDVFLSEPAMDAVFLDYISLSVSLAFTRTLFNINHLCIHPTVAH